MSTASPAQARSSYAPAGIPATAPSRRPATLAARPTPDQWVDPRHRLNRDRGPTLLRLTRLEIRKSLSTRSGRLLAGAAAVAPAAGEVVFLSLGGTLTTTRFLLGLLGALVAAFMLAVGVLATAGEWTHHTAQTTFLTVPRRHRVLIAKYAAMAVLGAAIAVVMVGTTLAVAAVGGGAALVWTGTGAAVVATIGTAAVTTMIGAGIGAAVANAPAALTGTYVFLLVGMNLLRAVKPLWAPKVDPLQAMGDLITGRDQSAGAAVAVLAGWVIVTSLAGAVVTRRKAVS